MNLFFLFTLVNQHIIIMNKTLTHRLTDTYSHTDTHIVKETHKTY